MILEVTKEGEKHRVQIPDASEVTLRQLKALTEPETELTEYEVCVAMGVPEDLAYSLTLGQVEDVIAAYLEFAGRIENVKPDLAHKLEFNGGKYTLPTDLNTELVLGQLSDIDTLVERRGCKTVQDTYPIVLSVMAEDGEEYSTARALKRAEMVDQFMDAPAVTAFAVCSFFINGAPRWTARMRQRFPNWPYLNVPTNAQT